MGKFSNKDLPSFLKKPNYYSEDEQFDNEAGRNPEVTEDCETCGQEPQIAENKVLRFGDFSTDRPFTYFCDMDGVLTAFEQRFFDISNGLTTDEYDAKNGKFSF